MLEHANGQATNQVDQQNQYARNGVTTHELRSTVHGTKEI